MFKIVNSPGLFRYHPRRKLFEQVHDDMKAGDVVILCYDYVSYFNAMYKDLKAIQGATTDERFHDQLGDQMRKNGEWKAFFQNLIAWYKESPRSDRLPKVFIDHAANIDHSINRYHLALREWDAARWEGRDQPGRFQRERHELPHHDGSQHQNNSQRQEGISQQRQNQVQQGNRRTNADVIAQIRLREIQRRNRDEYYNGRQYHGGQEDHRVRRHQDGRDRQQHHANHFQHDTRNIPGGHHRNQQDRPSGLEAWGFRAWPTFGDLRQRLEQRGGRHRSASVQPVARYDRAPKTRDS